MKELKKEVQGKQLARKAQENRTKSKQQALSKLIVEEKRLLKKNKLVEKALLRIVPEHRAELLDKNVMGGKHQTDLSDKNAIAQAELLEKNAMADLKMALERAQKAREEKARAFQEDSLNESPLECIGKRDTCAPGDIAADVSVSAETIPIQLEKDALVSKNKPSKTWSCDIDNTEDEVIVEDARDDIVSVDNTSNDSKVNDVMRLRKLVHSLKKEVSQVQGELKSTSKQARLNDKSEVREKAAAYNNDTSFVDDVVDGMMSWFLGDEEVSTCGSDTFESNTFYTSESKTCSSEATGHISSVVA